MSTIAAADRQALRGLARASIEHGLDHGRPLCPTPTDHSARLQADGASFVTLRRANGDLRGCIGRLEASRPLAIDVADNAFGAAFRDPRFRPLDRAEWADCTIKLSILTPAVPLDVRDEAELLATLEPGVDGLILDDGARRGTFLPAVWQSLPDPVDFVAQLKRKIGWPADRWIPATRAWRYRVDEF